MPKGYLIANITVTDPERYAEYRRQVLPVVEAHGGRFLVRGGALRRLEHAEAFDRIVVIEFASVDDAERFYRSPDYAPLLAMREAATRSQVTLVEGT